MFLFVKRPYRAACFGLIAAMAGFLVFWQAAQNPTKKIKFQRSHGRTSMQGIIPGTSTVELPVSVL
jgi:hypothetical protein